jgi:hypothetical protein
MLASLTIFWFPLVSLKFDRFILGDASSVLSLGAYKGLRKENLSLSLQLKL